MDASRLTIAFAILIVGYGLGRFLLGSASRAGDGLAALFVPPDLSLGWPRGVQESDEPWAWRAVTAAAAPTFEGSGEDLAAAAIDVRAVLALPAVGQGSYVAPPRKVAPIRVRVLG